MSESFRATPRLSRRLQLQTPTAVPDGAGGMTVHWTPLGMLWAAIDARSGRETGKLGIARSAVALVITVRTAPVGSSMRPKPDQRFTEGPRHYRITAVTEAGDRSGYLTCYATEEVAT